MENFWVILLACFASSFTSMIIFSLWLGRYDCIQSEFFKTNILPALATMVSDNIKRYMAEQMKKTADKCPDAGEK